MAAAPRGLARLAGSLLGRSILALLAVGLLPLAIASYRLVGLNRAAMAEQVLRTHVVSARSAAGRVGAFVEARRALAGGAAANAVLADPHSAAAANFLAENLKAWSGLGVIGVAVLDPRGELVVRAQLKGEGLAEAVAVGIAGRSPGSPAGQGRDASPAVELLALAPSPRLLLRVAAPLPQAAGEVVVVADAADVRDFLRPDELGDEAELTLIDGNGSAVLTQQGSGSPASAGAAGRPTMDDAIPPALLATARSGRVSGAARYARVDGSTVLGAAAPVEGTTWAVVSLQPTRVADRLAENVRTRALAALGAALLLIALLSMAAWLAVVRPIGRLAAAQSRLAGRAPGTAGTSIVELEASFAALERAIEDRRQLDAVSLGRYQVLEVLGSGGMGTVFRGFDPKLERPVALKIVPTRGEGAVARKHTDRLLREAVTVARFSHPHIVAVHDVQEAPGGAFVAMEFVAGCSLEALVDARGKLGLDQVAPLGLAVAEALAAAHRLGVAHRDVKPANVLLGQDGAIKVSDFGIAALLSGPLSSEPEGDDVIFGTPGFLAPEVLLEGRWGPAADLFALGVTLYFALSAQLPYGGESLRELLRSAVDGPPPRALRLARGAAGGDREGDATGAAEVEGLVQSLLERSPARRPASAQAVVEVLSTLCARHGWRWSSPPTAAESKAGPERPGQWLETSSLRR